MNVEFSIRHTVKDVDAVKNELLSKAVEGSKTKAEVLAKAAGVVLREIKTIDYSWEELEIYAEPMVKMMLAEPMEADNIDVQDTVNIVCEIR